jgi:hypothetical protein
LVEQADANFRRAAAQRKLNEAQLDQQKALLAASRRPGETGRGADSRRRGAGRAGGDNLRYTRISRPPTGSSASARFGPASSSMSARR